MKRRSFIATSGTLAAWPLTSRAQQGGRTRRIGVLMEGADNDPQAQARLAGFTEGISSLGWIAGRNVRIDIRWAGGNVDRMRVFAKELVDLQPDVLLAEGTPVTAAVQRETGTIAIVFVVVSDPVGAGYVKSLSSPGANITGFISQEASLAGKYVELLTQVAPGTKRAVVLFNPDTAPGGGSYFLPSYEAAARLLNVKLIVERVRSDAEIETAIGSLGGEPGGGVVVMPDFFMLVHRAPVISMSARNNVPAIYPWNFAVVKEGALLSYGPDLGDIVRRGATYVDLILRGAKPAELPVQRPVKFEMAINVKTAQALGLAVPPSILLRADAVIR
jgi:putative ABC transport system substrate-binding protein